MNVWVLVGIVLVILVIRSLFKRASSQTTYVSPTAIVSETLDLPHAKTPLVLKPVSTLNASVRVGDLINARCYEFIPTTLQQTNRLLEVEHLGAVYIKIPSPRGVFIHRDSTYVYKCSDNEVRAPEGLEKAESMGSALDRYSEYRALIREAESGLLTPSQLEFLKVSVHWLLLLHINNERLRAAGSLSLPDARFVFVSTPIADKTDTNRLRPAVIQKGIDGVLVRTMLRFNSQNYPMEVIPEFRQYIPAIARHIMATRSQLDDKYIDWNLSNFIYTTDSDTLWYVDPKPTVFIGRRANEHFKSIWSQFFR